MSGKYGLMIIPTRRPATTEPDNLKSAMFIFLSILPSITCTMLYKTANKNSRGKEEYVKTKMYESIPK